MKKEFYEIIDYYEKEYKDISIPFCSYKYSELSLFLDIYLNKKNAGFILNNLVLLMKYTNKMNMNYLLNPLIYNQKDFISKLSKSIKYYKYKDKIDYLIYQIYYKVGKDLITDELIKALLDLRLSNYTFLLSLLDDKRRFCLLKYILKNKIDCSFDIKYLKQFEKYYIECHVPSMIMYSKDLLELRSFTNKYKEIINKYINSNPSKLIISLFKRRFEIDENSYIVNLISYILGEICDNEHVRLSDIELIGVGAFSNVYALGDKIIKIGNTRNVIKLRDNPYILRPLIRKELVDKNVKVFFEITEKVDNTKVSEDDLYSIYKKIRDLKLVWSDVSIENIGRLIKDNCIHWNCDLNPVADSLNLKESNSTTILKRGELVLLDADNIYEEDEVLETGRVEKRKVLEKRYQGERR